MSNNNNNDNDLENKLKYIDVSLDNFKKTRNRNLIFLIIIELIILVITYFFINEWQIYIMITLSLLISFNLVHQQKTTQKFFKKMLDEKIDLLESSQILIKVNNNLKCQELLDNKSINPINKFPGIIVLKLSKYDEDTSFDNIDDRDYIISFSHLLLDVGISYTPHPFIGHYSDTEFILYFEDTSSDDEIEICLNKLMSLVKTFNQKETRFKLSYVEGHYYISSDLAEQLTIKQLYDEAVNSITQK